MSDRTKRKYRRTIAGYLLLAGLVFTLFRTFGPALISIRSEALEPYLRPGDTVLARPGTANLVRGSVVLADAPLRTGTSLADRILRIRNRIAGNEQPGAVGRPVVRFVAGLPGETVRWDHTGVTIGSVRYDTIFLHENLIYPETTMRIDQDEVFLLALQGGRADSRILGPVNRSAIRYHVQSIVWPAERRGIIENVTQAAP